MTNKTQKLNFDLTFLEKANLLSSNQEEQLLPKSFTETKFPWWLIIIGIIILAITFNG